MSALSELAKSAIKKNGTVLVMLSFEKSALMIPAAVAQKYMPQGIKRRATRKLSGLELTKIAQIRSAVETINV